MKTQKNKKQICKSKHNDSGISLKPKKIIGKSKYKQLKKKQSYYLVEQIIDRKIDQNKIWYKIRWQGYSEKFDTWEPYRNLKYDNVQKLIENFEEKQGNKFEIQGSKFKRGKEHQIEIKDNDQKIKNSQSQNKNLDKNFDIQNIKKEKQHIKNEVELISKKQNQVQDQEQNLISTSIQSSFQNQDLQIIQDYGNNFESHLGSYKNNDKVQNIVSLRKDEFMNEILFKVQWQKRQNGYIPDNSWIQNSQLKKQQPVLVFQFYESKITFVDN